MLVFPFKLTGADFFLFSVIGMFVELEHMQASTAVIIALLDACRKRIPLYQFYLFMCVSRITIKTISRPFGHSTWQIHI